MGRKFAIISVLISLLAMPQLCVGGLITHVCECVAEIDSHCDSDCDQESGCGHECGCCDDPCDVIVLRTERQDGGDVVILLPATLDTTYPYDDKYLATQRVHTLCLESLRRGREPYPPGELPLLI